MIVNPPRSFPRQARLLQKADFDRVFRCNRYRVKNRFFLMLATPNSAPCARLGLIAPKKYISKAVDRNQAKRLCRAYFCTTKSPLPPLDIVILIKSVSGKGAWRLFRLNLIESFRQIAAHAANN